MSRWIALAAFALAVQSLNTGHAEERHVYFGDLHLHTSMSFDAFIDGTRTMPEESYRFAMGEPVEYFGQMVKRRAPLDFLAVTDHSEYLGVLRLAADEHGPFAATDWPKRLASPNSTGISAVLEVAKSFGSGGAPIAEFRTAELIRSNWQRQIDVAEKSYHPGTFTSFVAYEWTSSPNYNNLHRNVIFGGPKYPLAPFSSVDSARPEDLWAYADNNRRNGIDSVIIPHNANLSGGLMFGLTDSDGKPITRDYAETRARNERLFEISQIKGSSETRPELSPDDEFAGFELFDVPRPSDAPDPLSRQLCSLSARPRSRNRIADRRRSLSAGDYRRERFPFGRVGDRAG